MNRVYSNNLNKAYKRKIECCGCGACAKICPADAIVMKEDGEGFLYPKINKKKCTSCGRCGQVCPVKSPIASRTKREDKNLYWGAQVKDDAIRYASTSGGVFSALGEYTLKKGGVVFGAVMERDGTVCHRMALTLEELVPMRKSKYVQSNLSDCYQSVEKCLKEGRRVLFTGTPCQCRAIQLYLNREWENLLLADTICYGVPSPGLWRNYRKELEQKYGGAFSGFCFRDKRDADNGHTVAALIGEKEYAYPIGKDLYCKMYFKDCTLRPSCYFCNFCTPVRSSDITMGDFWGIERVRPEMEDGMGTSLVILHNQKAEKMWKEIKSSFRYFQCNMEDVLQPRLCQPVQWPKSRKWFMLLNRFFSISLTETILRRLKLL